MPNWAENDLTIKGTKEDITEFKEFLKYFVDAEDDRINFGQVIPYPAKYTLIDKGVIKNTTDKDGYNSGGYDWCVNNWGTKWEGSSMYEYSIQDKIIKIGFQTAWAPPLPVIHRLSIGYPKLTFKMKSFEQGAGYKVSYEVKNGKHKTKEGKYHGGRGG